ncbi:MAG: DUF1800 domain-containing protein, partial [Acidimicrobiales bacterium]
MRSDEAETPEADAPADRDRRRALGMVAWSAGVALTGSVAARSRAATTNTVLDPRPRPATSPTAPSAAAVAAPTGAPSTTAQPATTTAPMEQAGPLSGDALVLHIAKRATFGPTLALLDEIRTLGVDPWLERQLAPAAIPDAAVDEELVNLRDLARHPADFRADGRVGDGLLGDLRVAALLRATRSNRHLQEVMVDLWHDHLTASAAKGCVEWHLPTYDRESIRPHALGRFADLLRAATRSGAMLEYLDTTSSSAPDVNENHGRELLELHTVGGAAGFTQEDVTGAARVLSGWTLHPQDLTVIFDPARHHAGPATVLGWSTAGGGGARAAGDLDSLLNHLATHPATATRIASLLVRRFVADAPPDSVVASTAAAYLATGTDIAATLRHLFATAEFRRAGAPILRRPFDLLVAQLRATGATLDVPNLGERLLPVAARTDPLVGPLVEPLLEGTGMMLDPLAEPLVRGVVEQRPIARSMADTLRTNGQLLFMAPNPSGHTITGSRWISGDALLRRWTLGALVAQDGLPGITVDPVPLAGGAPTAGAATDALARHCFGTAASAATRA